MCDKIFKLVKVLIGFFILLPSAVLLGPLVVVVVVAVEFFEAEGCTQFKAQVGEPLLTYMGVIKALAMGNYL